MNTSDFPFRDALRVRWAEVDMQKVVFNGHYLMYVDTAMGNYWRALALPYEATLEALDGDLFVRRSTLDYLAPARYDDALEVGIRFESAGTSSLRFLAAVFRGGGLGVAGRDRLRREGCRPRAPAAGPGDARRCVPRACRGGADGERAG